MTSPNKQGGFQPTTTPAERRAFFDLQRQLAEMLTRLAAAEARLDALEAGP